MLLGLEGRERVAADREQLFFSARVLVESLAMRGPTLLFYEDIHWADASLLDLLETFAARVRGRPCALPRARATGAPRRATRLGRRAPRVHGSAARAARRGCGSRARHAAPRPSRRARCGPSRSRRPPRATRSSSRSSPACIGERRATGSTSCRRASTRSSPRRLDALPAARARRSRRRLAWSAACSGAARCPRSRTEPDLSQVLGSLEARDLIQREAVSRIQGDQQFALQARADPATSPTQTLPRAARREKHAAVAPVPRRRRPTSASRTRRSRTTGARPGENDRAVEHLMPPPIRPVAAGRRSEPSPSTARRSSSSRRRRRSAGERSSDSSPSPSRPCTTSHRRHAAPPAAELANDLGRGLAGVVGEREVVGRHVAGDLVDRVDDVIAECRACSRTISSVGAS